MAWAPRCSPAPARACSATTNTARPPTAPTCPRPRASAARPASAPRGRVEPAQGRHHTGAGGLRAARCSGAAAPSGRRHRRRRRRDRPQLPEGAAWASRFSGPASPSPTTRCAARPGLAPLRRRGDRRSRAASWSTAACSPLGCSTSRAARRLGLASTGHASRSRRRRRQPLGDQPDPGARALVARRR